MFKEIALQKAFQLLPRPARQLGKPVVEVQAFQQSANFERGHAAGQLVEQTVQNEAFFPFLVNVYDNSKCAGGAALFIAIKKADHFAPAIISADKLKAQNSLRPGRAAFGVGKKLQHGLGVVGMKHICRPLVCQQNIRLHRTHGIFLIAIRRIKASRFEIPFKHGGVHLVDYKPVTALLRRPLQLGLLSLCYVRCDGNHEICIRFVLRNGGQPALHPQGFAPRAEKPIGELLGLPRLY